MAPLVRQRGERFIVVVVVEQQVGMHVVHGAVHVGARALFGARVDVHPAALRALRHGTRVVFAERLDRCQHQFDALADRVFQITGDHRRVDVVVTHLAQAQHARAQPEVTVQGGQIEFGLRHQRVVDGARQFVAIERLRQRVRITADFGQRGVLSELLVEAHAEGALKRFPLAPEGIEDQFAISAVAGGAVFFVGSLVEYHFGAVGQFDFGPGHIGIRQRRIDRVGRAGGRAESGDQLFALAIQRVRLAAQDVVEPVGVDSRRLVAFDQGIHFAASHFQDFGVQEGARFFKPVGQHIGTLLEVLPSGQGGVFVVKL